MSTPVLVAEHLTVDVPLAGKKTLRTVEDVSFALTEGSTNAIVGRSGSGKTSLLSVLGLLNGRFDGKLTIGGRDVRSLGDAARARIRNQDIGFVFQSYSLMPQLTATQNVTLATEYGARRRVRMRQRGERATQALIQVGLENKLDAYPRQLSGGEQQRVAIARALVNEPRIILADEPTGALDEMTGDHVMSMLIDRARGAQSALLLVTHDPLVADRCDRKFAMSAGALHELQEQR